MFSRRDFVGSAVAASALVLSGVRLRAQTSDLRQALTTNDGLGLAKLVKSGEVTPSELAEAAVQNALALNPRLNAITTAMYERALERARDMPKQGPFAGVPFVVKDNLDVAGMYTTHGSRVYADHLAGESAPLTHVQDAAGLNLIGKTNMPEVGALPTTEGQLLGACHNPWNLAHSPGGSSGGSAAAVAAGIVPLAHASDGGGSIRLPASMSGVFGLKPSRRRMVWGSSDQTGYAVDNCVSRSVRDSAMLFALAQDRSPTAAFRPIPFVAEPTTERLTVGIDLRNYHGESPHPDVAHAIEETARLCEGLGHRVVEVESPVDGAFENHFFALFAGRTVGLMELAQSRAGRPVSQTGMLDRFVQGFAEAGQRLPADAVDRATEYMTGLGREYSEWLSSMDVFLSPVCKAPPPELGYLFDPEEDFDEMSRRVFEFTSYTPVQNALGLPAMSVPLGMSVDGLPIGSHFVAAAGREDLLFALAYELEEAKPWAASWPPNSAVNL